MDSLAAQSRTAPESGTLRRVHSPVVATSRTVGGLRVVGGSRNASTPIRVRTKSSRCSRARLASARCSARPAELTDERLLPHNRTPDSTFLALAGRPTRRRPA